MTATAQPSQPGMSLPREGSIRPFAMSAPNTPTPMNGRPKTIRNVGPQPDVVASPRGAWLRSARLSVSGMVGGRYTAVARGVNRERLDQVDWSGSNGTPGQKGPGLSWRAQMDSRKPSLTLRCPVNAVPRRR
jgi:hypothetical protein